MSDLISRSALIAAFDKTVLPREFRIVKTPEARMVVAAHGKLVKRLIDEAPAVDAVPVVRCFNCKNRGNEDDCPLLSIGQYTDWDEYCSRGERKANAGGEA